MVSKFLLTPAVAGFAAAAILFTLHRKRRAKKIVITGGSGNLGTKLAAHLLSTEPGQWEVVLLEHPKYYIPERKPAGAAVVLGDLADGAGDWTSCLRGADSVVHFSAVNPYPNANFDESAQSMSHTFNVFLEAARHNVRRVVLASSNHVMGQYKEQRDHGMVKPTDPPMCGTPLRNPTDLEASGDAIAYSVAKLAGEQLCKSLAATRGAACRTSFYILRIGWCQPGANLPATITAAGAPPEFQTQTGAAGSKAKASSEPAEDVDGDWFKGMWLSNGDFLRYFTAALKRPDPPTGRVVLVNAMSANTGARWSLTETVEALGVSALDDVRRG